MEIEKQNFDKVESAYGITQGVGLLVLDYELDLGVCVTDISL